MVDAVIKNGTAHPLFCEDYACGAIKTDYRGRPTPIICVSDGCSSGERTERGAMLLCLSAAAVFGEQIVSSRPDPLEVLFGTLALADRQAKVFQLGINDMLATLKFAYVFDGIIYEVSAGDGYSFGKKTTGETILYEYEYSNNTPFYPAYKMFHQEASYAQQCNQEKLIIKEYPSLQEESEDATTWIFKQYPAAEYTYFGLSSDGLGTIEQTTFDVSSSLRIAPNAVAEELLAIKSNAGSFLTRRVTKGLEMYEKLGYRAQDDLGVAMIDIQTALKFQG